MNYATFWPRFAAIWIDFFVLLPFGLLNLWGQSVSKPVAMALVLPTAAFFSAYHIYCHGKFGQTIGKRVMGIRVVRLNGESIGWREAWMRSLVDVFGDAFLPDAGGGGCDGPAGWREHHPPRCGAGGGDESWI